MIIEHPNLRFIDKKAWEGSRACLVAQCDFCRTLAPRTGHDIGEAAEAAMKSGFKLVRGAKLSDPKKWSCGCR